MDIHTSQTNIPTKSDREGMLSLTQGSELIVRLNEPLNIERLRADLKGVEAKHNYRSKNESTQYLALGLQYTFPENVFDDAINTVATFTADGIAQHLRPHLNACTLLNEVGQVFHYVFERFQHLNLSRGRLLYLAPGGSIEPHHDGRNAIRLHIPIQTGSMSRFHFKSGESYHMSCDGSAYLVKASQIHWATNMSPVPRIHLVFHCDPVTERHAWKYRLERETSVGEKMFFYEALLSQTAKSRHRCKVCSATGNLVLPAKMSKTDGFLSAPFITVCIDCEEAFFKRLGVASYHYSEDFFQDWMKERKTFLHNRTVSGSPPEATI